MTADTTAPARTGTTLPDRTTTCTGAHATRPGPGGPSCATTPPASCDAPCGRCRRRRLTRVLTADDGAATAEYAVVILAAVGFAGLLVTLLRSDEVRGFLTDLVRRALTVG